MDKVIAILIGFLPNPRMYKRIELEKKLGQLHLICWDKGNSMLLPPEEDGYKAHVFSVPASGDPIKRMLPYMKFSTRAYAALKEIRPDIIHVQGLDMLKIAHRYKKTINKNVSIIYEVADLHRLLVDKQKHPLKKIIQAYLCHEDRRLEKSYDLLLLTSMKFFEVYFSKFVRKEKILYMPNVPDLSAFTSYEKKKNRDEFTVGYIGSVRYKQQMRNMVEAAQQNNMRVLIAGFENEPVEIEPLCKDNPRVEWVGRFDFDKQAASLYGKCDVMYSVYDADMHNVRVALPNKLYEAVYCEMPLIVAKNTYLAQIVDEWGVGVSVDHKSVAELTQVFAQLQNDLDMYERIVENCRQKKADVGLQRFNILLEKRIRELLA